MTGSIMRIQYLRERTIYISGAKIFNSIPCCVREFKGEFSQFKILVDSYLAEVPDCPLLEGYVSHNLDSNLKMSNSIIVRNNNLNAEDWLLETRNTESWNILK